MNQIKRKIPFISTASLVLGMSGCDEDKLTIDNVASLACEVREECGYEEISECASFFKDNYVEQYASQSDDCGYAFLEHYYCLYNSIRENDCDRYQASNDCDESYWLIVAFCEDTE